MKTISHRPLSLWFLNHEFTPDEIAFQIKEMKQKGFGGFFMHWLNGGEPYLSREWFRMLDVAIEQAARLKLEAWLYDEAWCPSCWAGGRILARRPELGRSSIWQYHCDARGGETVDLLFDPVNILSAMAIPIKNGAIDPAAGTDIGDEIGTVRREIGMPFVNRDGYYPHVPPIPHWRLRSPKTLLWQLKWRAPRGNDWRIHIACEIRSFSRDGGGLLDTLNRESAREFINETHEKYKERYHGFFGNVIPGIMTDESKFNSFPYTPSLPALYEKRYSESFCHALPALTDNGVIDHRRIRAQYHRLVSDLFRENYIKPISDWCRKNGLLLTGHISPEECPWQEVKLLGNLAGALRHFHIPGTDLIIQAIGDSKHKALNLGPRAAASVARQQGKNEVFVEVGACCKESLSLEQLKTLCDWLMVNGINMITFHGIIYSTDGARKFITDQNLSVYNNLWKDIRVLTDYLADRCKLLREYRPRPKIALLKPLYALRTLTMLNNAIARPIGDPPSRSRQITGGIIWQQSDPARDKIDRSLIDICWQLLESHQDFDLLDEDSSDNWNISSKKLRLNKAVYRTIIIPNCPVISDDTAKKLSLFADSGGAVIFVKNIPAQCRAYFAGKPVLISKTGPISGIIPAHSKSEFSISGVGANSIMSCCVESEGGRKALFLTNISGTSRSILIRHAGRSRKTDFAAFESKFLCPESFFSSVQKPVAGKHVPVVFQDNWKISAANDNHLPLTQEKTCVRLEGKSGQPYLVCDESEINEIKNGLSINGRKLDAIAKKITTVKFYDSHNLRIDLPGVFKNGKNIIIFKRKKKHLPTLLLAGRFSAHKLNGEKGYRLSAEPRICDRVSRIKCGYPFLRGELEFKKKFSIRADLKPGAYLELPNRKGSVSVMIDGRHIGTIAWQPNIIALPALKTGTHELTLRVVGDSIGLLRGPPREAGISNLHKSFITHRRH